MDNRIDKVLISQEDVMKRSAELGRQITKDYQDKGEAPYVVGLLKGSVAFLSELIKHIDLDIAIDFMDVSSYEGTKRLEKLIVNKDLDVSIEGLSILLVEDVVETGRTLIEVKELLINKGAKEVRVVSLLDKVMKRKQDVSVEYIGFSIPDEFVVGFGLDYKEIYRNLPYIGVLKPELYK